MICDQMFKMKFRFASTCQKLVSVAVVEYDADDIMIYEMNGTSIDQSALKG